jgi:hypothetical protein
MAISDNRNFFIQIQGASPFQPGTGQQEGRKKFGDTRQTIVPPGTNISQPRTGLPIPDSAGRARDKGRPSGR